MGKVTVYKVQLYDAVDEEPLISTRMATPKGAHMMGGDIVEGSGVDIDASQLEPGAQWTPRDFIPSLGLEAKKRRISKRPWSSPGEGAERRPSAHRGTTV